ncbi:hypothetical protein FA09DRAFT_11571 [Tilletiopsis washingtonensis]|uniref:Uncharacterized protein n=1 Tax=Tilletiopsis washingtonensis TaxID=58919 RepID=A0A316ZIJ2_9BASI|nr:hypothetical protein FA09DRAFT_11571 [Tilletiopsis washingtonensis]PWO01352.1 hypothetical protein FA09DRAFT_11571 [Tilletiopsis washingtonensis]
MPALPRSEWTDFEPPDSGCSDEDEAVAARSSGSKLEAPSSHAAASSAATPSPIPRKRQRLALQEDLFRFDDENDEHAVRILAAGEEGAAELEDVSVKQTRHARAVLTSCLSSTAASSPVPRSSRRSSAATNRERYLHPLADVSYGSSNHQAVLVNSVQCHAAAF